MVGTHFCMEFLEIKYTGLFYNIYLRYLPAKASEKVKKCSQKVEIDGIFPKRQVKTPKEKRQPFVSHWVTFHTAILNTYF